MIQKNDIDEKIEKLLKKEKSKILGNKEVDYQSEVILGKKDLKKKKDISFKFYLKEGNEIDRKILKK